MQSKASSFTASEPENILIFSNAFMTNFVSPFSLSTLSGSSHDSISRLISSARFCNNRKFSRRFLQLICWTGKFASLATTQNCLRQLLTFFSRPASVETIWHIRRKLRNTSKRRSDTMLMRLEWYSASSGTRFATSVKLFRSVPVRRPMILHSSEQIVMFCLTTVGVSRSLSLPSATSVCNASLSGSTPASIGSTSLFTSTCVGRSGLSPSPPTAPTAGTPRQVQRGRVALAQRHSTREAKAVTPERGPARSWPNAPEWSFGVDVMEQCKGGSPQPPQAFTQVISELVAGEFISAAIARSSHC
mmetsp:Transcript_59863/g.139458  ORF Transcript_59863/g.139458 Transcript_59863/m.139458 type:complete len:303 (+) Transcript_59863:1123-2031(+)